MKRAVAVVSAGVAVLLAVFSAAQAQPAAPQRPTQPLQPPASQPGKYLGVTSCAATGCHGSPVAVENSPVQLNEYDLWLHAAAPSHPRAYDVLFNPLSRRIARNLKLKSAPEESKVCLDCHTTNVPASQVAGVIEVTDGIQCEACHGPAGGWRAEHVQEGWTHEQSVKRGMYDLRDNSSKSRVCLRCHMGNATQEVNHDLIAAGHPILNFELDNFSESTAMPQHWKPISEKPEEDRWRDTRGLPAWAAGVAVAFQQEAENLGRHARSEQWPEFVHMSCDGCHHPLREGEWRQERGYGDRPGLVRWSPARWIILRQIVKSVAPGELAALEKDVDALSRAVSRMNSAQVISASSAVSKRVGGIVPKIESASWSSARAQSLINAIAGEGRTFRDADRQSAEQASYALLSLTSYLANQNPALARGSLARQVDLLFRQVEKLKHPDEFRHDEFIAVLDQIQGRGAGGAGAK